MSLPSSNSKSKPSSKTKPLGKVPVPQSSPSLSGDTLVATDINQTLVGGPGHQHLYSAQGLSTLLGGVGNSTLVVNSVLVPSSLVTSAKKGTSTIVVPSNLPVHVGQTISGNGIPDGTKIVSITHKKSKVYVKLSSSLISGLAKNAKFSIAGDSLVGGTGNSNLYASGSSNTLVGSTNPFFSGYDTLVANGPFDSVYGGYGNNSLYATSLAATTELIKKGSTLKAGSVINGTVFASDTILSTHDLLVTGSATLATGSRLESESILETGSILNNSTLLVNETLAGVLTITSQSTLAGYGVTMVGGVNSVNARTTLSSAAPNASLVGSGLSNTIFSSASGDTLVVNLPANSSGSSTLNATGFADLLVGCNGQNSLYASGIADTLVAGSGTSTLVATGYGASLLGSSGPNSLCASGTADTLTAGTGTSFVSVSGNADLVVGSTVGSSSAFFKFTSLGGYDTFVGGSGNSTVLVEGSHDVILGGSGASSLLATGSWDSMLGGAGTTTLIAFGKNDTIQAGRNVSTLIAGISTLNDSLTINDSLTNSETLLGASSFASATLYGNGHSSLVGLGGQNLYILNTPGDTVSDVISGNGLLINGSSTVHGTTYQLQSIVPSAYVSATISGNSLSAVGHTATTPSGTGDTIIGLGNSETVTGGVGADYLQAFGNLDYFVAGSAAQTLTGTTLLGSNETLVGNGKSLLVSNAAPGLPINDYFILPSLSGDTISLSVGGLSVQSSGNLNLNTEVPGAYVVATISGAGTLAAAHQSLLSGSGTITALGSTLSGDTLFMTSSHGSLIGGSGADSLIASGSLDTLIAGTGNNTLVARGSGANLLIGSSISTLLGNGHSSLSLRGPLMGNSLSDLFILGTPGDTITGVPSISGNNIRASYSVQLDSLDPTHYDQVTLNGDLLTGTAHQSIITGTTLAGTTLIATGDTMIATGNKGTLIAGAGRDSLVALGTREFLVAGTGNDTLVGPSLPTATATLFGNGKSTLIGNRANDYFIAPSGNDSISEVPFTLGASGQSTIATGVSRFYLNNDSAYGAGAHGSGVLNVGNLIFTGVGGSTLVGGTLGGSIIGATSDPSSLVAGPSGAQTLIGGASNDTLVGNGSSSLVGASGNDLYIINTQGDHLGVIPAGGIDTLQTSLLSFDLNNTAANGPGVLGIEVLVSTSTIGSTLYGNSLNNTIIGASLGNDFVQGGAQGGGSRDSLVTGAGNDTLVGNGLSTLSGGGGSNTYYTGTQQLFASNGSGLTTVPDDLIIDSGTGGTIYGSSGGYEAFYYDLSAESLAPGINYVAYTGASPATLGGNASTLGDTLVGGIGANSLTAGSGGAASLVGNGASDTLNDGGFTSLPPSTMSGGGGNDFYIVSNPQDLIVESFGSTGGIDAVLTTLTSYDLSNTLVGGGDGVENLIYTGNGSPVTLSGNQLNNVLNATGASSATLIGAGNAPSLFGASSGGFDTLLGSSSGQNLFEVYATTDLGNITKIIGGGNTDTLEILTSGSLTDAAFGSSTTEYISSVEILSLTSSSWATLGSAAQNAGITTVITGTGFDTINVSGYSIPVTLDARADTTASGEYFTGSAIAGTDFLFSGTLPLKASTIISGSGLDTLSIASPVTWNDNSVSGGLFSNDSGLDILQLSSPSAVTLGGSLQGSAQNAGITTVVSGTGGDVVNASTYSVPITFDATVVNSLLGETFTGSATAPSTFLFSGSNATTVLSLSSIIGGKANDSVIVTSASTLSDSLFSRMTSIQALEVSGDSAVTLGAAAQAAGISTLAGLLGNDTFTQSAAFAVTIEGGSGSNLFNISSGAILANDSIVGGYGTNTLDITSASTLADASFSHLSNIDVLQLTGSTAITLGAGASSSGISTIVAGNGAETINASLYAASLTVDTTKDSLGGSCFIGSTLGENLFLVSNSTVLGGSTFTGGAGLDTLEITQPITLSGSGFSNIVGIEALSLTSSSSVTIGSLVSGLNTLFTGTGPDTIDATAYVSKLTIDASADTVITGTGDSLVGSSSGDLFILPSTDVLSVSTITGGSGKDTLALATALTSNDSFGANINGIEGLSLTGSSAVSLGSSAATIGFASVIAGTGGDSITQLAGDTLHLTLLGGTGNDSFSVANTTLLGNDSVSGGGGTDTLNIGSAGTLGDSVFGNNISGIQVLQLTSPSSVSLSSNAMHENVTSVFGGSGSDSITQAGSDTLHLYLAGGAGPALFSIANASLLTNDTILGGASLANTLSITSPVAALADSVFGNVSGIQLLQLSSATSATLAGNAQAAGITTIVAGTGPDTINASSFLNGVTIDASAATVGDNLSGSSSAGNTFILPGSVLSTSTIAGGFGISTLNLSTSVSLNDAVSGNITGIKVLQLTSPSGITLGSGLQASGITEILGGSGNDSFTQTFLDGNALTLVGESLGNLFSIANSTLLAADSLLGGNGNDTLSVGGAPTLADTAFTRISQIGNLSLYGGATAVTLGANAANFGNGIRSVWGGAGDDTFFESGGFGLNPLQLNGGSQNNLFVLNSASQLLVDTITGGGTLNGHASTLQINSNAALSDTAFAHLQNVEYLSLEGNGASSVTLGLYASQSGIQNVYGGPVSDTIIQTSADTLPITMIGGNGDNLFSIANFSQSDSVLGGSGISTLQLSGGGLQVSSLAKVSNISVLDITGPADQITLGNAVSDITTIIGGSGPTSVDGTGYSTGTVPITWNFAASKGSDLLIGGSSGNIFGIRNAANLDNSTIIGGTPADTLQLLTGGQTIGDQSFANDQSIGILRLGTAAKGNSVTVGTDAGSAGISSIYGGASADTINASLFAGSLYVNNFNGTGSYIVGGTGSDTLIGSNLVANTFVLSNAANIPTTEIIGSNTGNDTLAFTQQTSIDQTGSTDLSGVNGIGAIEFLAAGNQLNLNSDALKAGIRTIIGGQGSDTGGDYLDATNYGTVPVLIQITDQSYLANSTITGDKGVDTLKFSRNGVSVTDADFLNLSDIQVIQTANGNNRFLLSNSYETEGVKSLIGGTGKDTIDLTDTVAGFTPTSTITYDLSKGSGYTFITPIENFYNTTSSLSSSRILGGAGANQFVFSDAGSVTDVMFANEQQANIGTMIFSGGTTQATLGTNAAAAGIRSLYLGLSDQGDTINVSSFSSPLTIYGDLSPLVSAVLLPPYNDSIAVETSFAELSNLTFNAHPVSSLGGNDSLVLIGTDARAITSDSLNGTFDALVLGNGKNFVQLTSPNNTGLTSIFGGLNQDTINVQGFTSLQGVDLVVNFLQLPTDSLEGGYIYSGGKGRDTVSIATGSMAQSPSNVINDADFSRMTNIQAFGLDATGGTDLILGQTGSYDDYASATGIHTILGGAGNDTIDASEFAPLPWWNGTSNKPWNFDVVLPNASALGSDVISGVSSNNWYGSGGQSNIHLTQPYQIIADSFFASGNITNIQGLQMDTLQADSLNVNQVTLGNYAIGSGIDSFNGGSGFSYLSISNESFLLSTVSGGIQATLVGSTNVRTTQNGYDTLTFNADAQSFTDADFKYVSNFQVFEFNQDAQDTGSAVTLGANALATGFSSVFGGIQGAAGNSITQDAKFTAPLYIDVSQDGGDLISLVTVAQLGADTIIGSGNADTLFLNGAQGLNDARFANVSNLGIPGTSEGVLNVGGVNNNIVLAQNAQSAGITQVIINQNSKNGGNTIDVSGTSIDMTLNAGGYASRVYGSGADYLYGSQNNNAVDTFVLAKGNQTYYATTKPTPGTGATNYASINQFTSSDQLQLLAGQSYFFGSSYNDGTASTNHFGIYAPNGNLVADVTTNYTTTVNDGDPIALTPGVNTIDGVKFFGI
jgi:Ca2+-binding RTX toxin-like protein